MNAEQLLAGHLNNTLDEAQNAQLLTHFSQEELDQFISGISNLNTTTKPVQEEWEKFKKNRPSKHPKRKVWVLYAIGLLLLLGLGYFVTLEKKTEVSNTSRDTMIFAMSDKTSIHLAPGSSIAYKKEEFKQNRKIWLDGHAYFDVQTKGDFQVVANDVHVYVLGTEFDIWSYGKNNTRVQCSEGEVDVVNYSGNSASISAGQEVYSNNERIVVGDYKNGPEESWMKDQLIFNNVPLSSVYSEIESFYAIDFEGKIADIPFTGRLPKKDIDKVLNILGEATANTYDRKGDKVTIVAD